MFTDPFAKYIKSSPNIISMGFLMESGAYAPKVVDAVKKFFADNKIEYKVVHDSMEFPHFAVISPRRVNVFLSLDPTNFIVFATTPDEDKTVREVCEYSDGGIKNALEKISQVVANGANNTHGSAIAESELARIQKLLNEHDDHSFDPKFTFEKFVEGIKTFLNVHNIPVESFNAETDELVVKLADGKKIYLVVEYTKQGMVLSVYDGDREVAKRELYYNEREFNEIAEILTPVLTSR